MNIQPGRPKCIWDAKSLLGECPLFDHRNSTLYWVDIKGEMLFAYDPKLKTKNSWCVPGKLSALGLSNFHQFIAVTASGFHHLQIEDDNQVRLTPLVNPEADLPYNRFNDAKVDPLGGFWAGTMDDNEQDTTAGQWWRLSPNGEVLLIDKNFHIPNGPAFDVDKSLVYFTDSAKKIIYRADISPQGEPQNKEIFLSFEKKHGFPDGMTVDKYGGLWVAFWDGYCIRRFDRSGHLVFEIRLPTPRVTSITLGGKSVFITTASVGLTPLQLRDTPFSGGLFEVNLNEDVSVKSFIFGTTQMK